MTEIVSQWPRKTRELQNHHMDSTFWNDFTFRDDDIIVSTYGKSGTTWTQQIVSQLVFGAEDVPVNAISPWWDMRMIPPEVRQAVQAQTHRRILKTHLQADALLLSPKAKYLYVARDGRDVIWSMYNHHAAFKPEIFSRFNDLPGLVGPPLEPADPDIRRYFRTWLENDGEPFWSFWENTESWWALRHLPNVKLVHFNRLKADLEGEMRAIAAFLEIDLPEAKWPDAVRHSTFDYMKAHADLYAPMGGSPWESGGETFINKGTNGRWRDVLTAEESFAYEQMALEKLGPECAKWLATGEGG